MPLKPFTYTEGLHVLEANKHTLPFATGVERDEYVREFARLTSRQPEDYRAAVQIAIDAAKSLIAIGIAFFAAIGAFIVQFATSHSSVIAIPIGFLALAGLLAVISMIAGFYAIGDAYNRAENPGSTTAGGPSTPAWSTVPLRTPLNVQSLAGLAALCCFGVAISLWNFGDPSSGIAVKPAVSSATPVGARGTFGLEGVWTKLKVRHGTFSVELDPTPASQVSAFQVELH